MTRFLMTVGSVFWLASTGFGWGTEGHQIVARIAEINLTKKAKTEIQKILADKSAADETDFERPLISGPEVAAWADRIKRQDPWKQSGPWHYVNITIKTERSDFNVKKACAAGCVITKIIEFANLLKKPEAIKEASGHPTAAEALKFLVHFVGDLSQPLHNCENDNDRGGNERKVTFLGKETVDYGDHHDHAMNLHAVWDSGIINERLHRLGKHLLEYAASLNASITPSQRSAWVKTTGGSLEQVTDWSWEAHKLAADVAYNGISPNLSETSHLNEAYYHQALKVVESQLQSGGVRLAYMLNAIFN